MEMAWELYFGSKLRTLERSVGMVGAERLTQKQIGGMIGVSQQTISRYYNTIRVEDAPLLLEEEFRHSDEKPPASRATLIRNRTKRIVKIQDWR